MEIYKKMNAYMESYDSMNPNIAIKIKHTYSVINKAKAICESLQLKKEDTDLACIIALLHDIGRFEQLKRYNSFIDHLTIDHALLGVQILFEDKLIEHFLESREYDSIIYYAIKNHNKLEIESGLDNRTMLHCKIIRDADKLDNLELKCKENFEVIYHTTKEAIAKETISQKVYQSICSKQQINSKDRQTKLDMWLTHVGFIFDFNFKYCFQEIDKYQYASNILHQVQCIDPITNQQIQTIEKIVNTYIKDKINESK